MIVLASGSASRQAMLTAAGVPFTAMPAAIDERAVEAGLTDATPGAAALALADAKALAVSRDQSGLLVLGSDSLVVCGGRRFDKPASRAEAAAHLAWFSQRTIELHSVAGLAHALGMLIVYIPKEKIVVQADLYNPQATALNASNRTFYQNLQRLKLDVATVVGIHGNPGPMASFVQLMSKAQ